MKNFLKTVMLTPFLVVTIALVFLVISIGVLIGGVVAIVSTPVMILNALNMKDYDRRKILGDFK